MFVMSRSGSWGFVYPAEYADMVTAEPSSSLQWPSVSQPAQNKEEQVSNLKVATNAWAAGCAPLLPSTKPGVVAAAALLQDWSGVRCRPLAVMCSVLALTDDCCPWSWRVFTLSPLEDQEQHRISRGQLQLHWLLHVISPHINQIYLWHAFFSKTLKKKSLVLGLCCFFKSKAQ